MFLEYKDAHIFYTDKGKGNPIVLLHGFLENSSMWLPFITSLSKNKRVICIDLLGHGQTDCLGYIHTMELMAEAVEALLKKLKITKVIFVGHSMGGYVALAFAEKNPEMVKGLCLMNSTAQADSSERKKNRDRAILVVKQDYKMFVNMAISNLFRPKNRILFSEEIKQIKKEALQTPLQGIIAALEGMKTRKNREKILQIASYKQLMIISKKDPVLDYDSLINQTINTCVKVVEFPDGHMSHIENKEDLLNTLMRFVEKI